LVLKALRHLQNVEWLNFQNQKTSIHDAIYIW
jgi:hypothetical protein